MHHRRCIRKWWYRPYLRCCHRCSRIRAAEILHAVPWNSDQLSVHCTGYRYHRSDCTGYPQIHREEVIFYDHVSKKAGSSAVLQQNSLLLFRCPFSAFGSVCCSGIFRRRLHLPRTRTEAQSAPPLPYLEILPPPASVLHKSRKKHRARSQVRFR